MKVTVFGGLEVQSEVIDLPSDGMSRAEYIEAGGQGAVWDLLNGGGIVIAAPQVVTPASISPASIEEGSGAAFTPAIFSGTEPMTIETYYTENGGPPVVFEPAGYTYLSTLDGVDKTVVFTQIATNSAGTISSTVELEVSRIPVSPYVITPPAFGGAFGAVGTPITLDVGDYGGDPTLVISFTVIDTQNSINYSSTVSGTPLTFTPTAATDTLVLTVTVENSAGSIVATDSIGVENAILINNGLSPATAEVLVTGDSQMMGLLYDPFDEGAQHTWSQVFRSAYTGGFSGSGPVGGLPGIGRAAFMGPANGSYYLWNTATGFPAGQDPHTNMANFDATMISERNDAYNPLSMYSAYGIEGHAAGGRLDLIGMWQIAQAAVAGGQQTIFLDQTRLPLNAVGGTYAPDGENLEWRTRSNEAVRISRIRYDYLRHRLNQAGHSNVNVFVVPRAELSNQMYDQIVGGTAPAPVLAAMPSWLGLYSPDPAYPEYHNHHYYMFSPLGVYAEWCLTYAVWFATSPVGISNTCTYDGATYTVDPDVAAWMQNLAWEVATGFDLCGLGEPLSEVRDWEPYQGQTLDQMFPNNLNISVADDPVLTTGGGPAANGDPVISLAGLTPSGANPTKGPLEVVFDNSPVSGTIPPTNPKCGVLMFSVNAADMPDNTAEYLAAFGSGPDFRVGFIKNAGGWDTRLHIDIPGGYYLWVSIPIEWADGRPLVMIWTAYDMNDSAEGRSYQVAINPLSGSAFDGNKYRRQGENRDWDLTTNHTTAQIGGPANGANTTQMEFYAMTVFDEKPRDVDLIKTLAYLEAQFGGPLWPSEVYS